MRKLVNMRLDEGLLRRVDEAAGRRGRTRFVERALEAALSGDPIGGTPSADKSPGGSASARPAASPRAPVERRGNIAQAPQQRQAPSAPLPSIARKPSWK